MNTSMGTQQEYDGKVLQLNRVGNMFELTKQKPKDPCKDCSNNNNWGGSAAVICRVCASK